MKLHLNIYISLFTLLLLFTLSSCNKSSDYEDGSRVILKVNLSESIKHREEWCYIAAFSPQGELLGVGSLSDSVNWEMKVPTYTGDKIDILTYEIDEGVHVSHYQDIDVGAVFDQSMSGKEQNSFMKSPFSDDKLSQLDDKDLKYSKRTKAGIPHYSIVLKVEDFGTDPLIQFRGSRSDEPIVDNWNYKNDGTFFYWNTYIRSDSLAYDGLRLSVTDKITLEPYVYYGELLGAGFKRNDTLVLHKSDFVKGEIKNIDIIDEDNTYNTYNSATFNAYNISDAKVDFLCTQNKYNYSESFLGRINCLVSDNLRINKWNFSYSTSGSHFYFSSHSELPNEIKINKISDFSISSGANSRKSWYLKHGHVNSNLTMGASQCDFYYYMEGLEFVYYTFCISGGDSVGVSELIAFEIPDQIINDMQLSSEFQSLRLRRGRYRQYFYDNTDIYSINFLKEWMGIESIYADEKEIYSK